jgi:SPFH domain / Band 7 family
MERSISRGLALVGAMSALSVLAGCGQWTPEYFSVPAGYVCKVLGPNGFEGEFQEAGQINLGGQGVGGILNRVVCIQTTTVQVEEQMLQDDPRDHQDHRILTRVGNRIAIDSYVRMIVPHDSAIWTSILAQVTPRQDQNYARASYINVEDIYQIYAHQEVRGFMRDLGPHYENDLDMNNDRQTIANTLTTHLSARLTELHAPLELQGITISNIAPDPTVQNARNVALTTASVNQVAASLTSNYVKLEGIRAQERMINVLSQSRTPVTVIFGVSPDIAVPSGGAQAKE